MIKLNCEEFACGTCAKINGKAVKKMVFAGVGKPINETDCLVSILNFANLNIDMKGINKATKGRKF